MDYIVLVKQVPDISQITGNAFDPHTGTLLRNKLESTINADAASRQTGITSFHQSEGATRRWTVTRSARSTIVRHLFDKADINTDSNPNHELGKSKVAKYN